MNEQEIKSKYLQRLNDNLRLCWRYCEIDVEDLSLVKEVFLSDSDSGYYLTTDANGIYLNWE